MISRNFNGNFFSAHYDWLVLGVGALALCGAGMFLLTELSVESEERAEEISSPYGRNTRGIEGVKKVELADYERAVRQFKSPTVMAAINDHEASFLASAKRIHCRHCAMAIPFDAKSCVFCKGQQPEEVKVVLDADEDGLPDEWERKHGLSPANAADANEDADKDLFTNKEEFEAGTDPTDRRSHPDYLDYLKIELPLKETVLSFYFVKAMPIPSGVRYYFKDPKAKNDYGMKGAEYAVLKGEEIGRSGFAAVDYEKRSEKRKIKGGGGATREYDTSIATVERMSDGRRITLTVGEKAKPIDVQADLSFRLGTANESFTVVPGDKIDLNGEKYTVKALKSLPKGAEITLENVLTEKIRTLQTLE